MDKLRVIQIGVGGFGKAWLSSVLKVEEVELVAIADVVDDNLNEAKSILEGRGIPAYLDHKKAFEEVHADIALIITPPHTHASLTKDAVAAGMHVIMEKPVAAELEDAFQLAEYAKTCGKYVAVNQNYRWRPEIVALKNAVDSGQMGAVENVVWYFARNHTRANFSSGWRSSFGEIMLKEMSIHHFDMMRFILGKNPTSVYAESMNPTWSWIKSNAVASALLRFDGGVFANYFASWVSRGKDSSWNGDIRIICSGGAIELTDDIPYTIGLDGVRENIPMPEMKYINMEYTIYDMVQSIRGNRLPVTHIGDNLNSWSMVCAAVDSVQRGVKVSI